MDKPDRVRTASPARSTSAECCTESACESGLKNHYFEGKQLTPDMFRIEQRYLVERRRLLNRAIHGWGVVYGYAIDVAGARKAQRDGASRTLRVGAGLALDQCGRELLQVGTAPLTLENVIVLDDNGRRTEAGRAFAAAEQYGRKPANDVCWLLSVHYAEQDAGRVRVSDPCHCDSHEWDHTCETVRYVLRSVPCRDCCAPDPCELRCDCGAGPCCDSDPDPVDRKKKYDERDAASTRASADRDAKAQRPIPDTGTLAHPRRGGCRCICDYLTGLQPGDDCDGTLCEIEEPCGRVRVDLAHGVPLACVGLIRDDCGWTFADYVEACGPRRLVKRNDLLFDLVRGCDLTRIVDFGWKDWHRLDDPVSFDDFSHAMGADGDEKDEYVTNDFWVKFSRPVRESTLRPDAVVITVLSVEREGHWRQALRVPIVRLDPTVFPAEPGDPDKHVRGARVVVEGGWVEDGLRGRASLFRYETWIEIEIRGDFIVDCNGQAVDLSAHGRAKASTGNGTPGGTFLSTFRVAPREAPARYAPQDPADRLKGASS